MFNKKVLITGATGFIGSHMTELFIKKGFKVIAFDRYNSNNDWGWLENNKFSKNDLEIKLGDIRDYDSVYSAMSDCDSVIHLAALIGIPYSLISPLAYIKTNIEGTYNILESAKNLKIDNILITSTSETYGSAQYIPIDEKHEKIGQSPYAASKISADQISMSYYKSYDLPIKIVRPFNTYGPRQSARAIIPTIISQLINKKNKHINLGNLSTTRDFTYVVDTCKAFHNIYTNDKFIGTDINIGTGTEISIKELYKTISNVLNIDKKIKIKNNRSRSKTFEVDRLVCDNKKLITNSNWKPTINIEKGIKLFTKWLNENNNIRRYKSETYNV